MLDDLAREYLNMSGDEFMKAWDSGKFGDDSDRPEIMRLIMLLPFVRNSR